MYKKKITTLAFIFSAVITATTAVLTTERKPVYVSDAETRTGSYLTSSYGPVQCLSSRVPEGEWVMLCVTRNKKYHFEYHVLPAETSSRSESRSFYLVATSEHARESAEEGLMRYLQVDTVNR